MGAPGGFRRYRVSVRLRCVSKGGQGSFSESQRFLGCSRGSQGHFKGSLEHFRGSLGVSRGVSTGLWGASYFGFLFRGIFMFMKSPETLAKTL